MDAPAAGTDDPSNFCTIIDDPCLPSPESDSLSTSSYYGISTVVPPLLPQPQPSSSQISDCPTPYTEPFPDLTFASVGAVTSIPVVKSDRHPLFKSPGRNFRLPSFESVGSSTTPIDYLSITGSDMALPEKSRLIGQRSLDQNQYILPLRAGGLLDLSSSLSLEDPCSFSAPSEIHQYIITRTPAVDGEQSTDLSAILGASIEDPTGQSMPTLPTGQSTTRPVDGEHAEVMESQWMRDVIPRVVLAIDPRLIELQNLQIRILTHALPMPSHSGHCFPAIIKEVNNLLSPQKTTWISHWHAVSGRYNLAELPTTPPTTPGAPGLGDDYFTTRVFDSAVTVPDYQRAAYLQTARDHSLLRGVPTTTQPRPAVPPSSVHLSITERYIPPTSASEFVDLFDPTSGRSLLADRLTELADDSGLLVFIYPTKQGGMTFQKEYLGSVLDPLLRRMMIINDLAVQTCQEIGSMRAVDTLPTFEEMKARVHAFCETLNASPSSTTAAGLSEQAVKYQIVDASRKHLNMAPEIWTTWWTAQEKPRLRKVFEDYIRLNPGRGRSSSSMETISIPSRARMREAPNADGGSMSYIVDVIEGLKKGAKEKASQSRNPIEVGLFVIRKQMVQKDDDTSKSPSAPRDSVVTMSGSK